MKHDLYSWVNNTLLTNNRFDDLLGEILAFPEQYFSHMTIKDNYYNEYFKVTSELTKESLEENLKDLFLLKEIIE